jgi:large subunit ribosomal protein L10
MSRFVKDLAITEIQSSIEGAEGVLVVDLSRLPGVDVNRLRVASGEKNINLMTVKSSLARAACSRIGMTALTPALRGSATLVWGGDDIVALSREVASWAKASKNIAIVGGAVDGQSLDDSGVDSLSKSPGRPELLSIIAGAILGPGGRVAGALLGPGGLVAGAVETVASSDD